MLVNGRRIEGPWKFAEAELIRGNGKTAQCNDARRGVGDAGERARFEAGAAATGKWVLASGKKEKL